MQEQPKAFVEQLDQAQTHEEWVQTLSNLFAHLDKDDG